ncbi:hypothetical protein R1flu_008089 [Riccia fluitans]|uniref:Uncharacterized protein n=1 Tax=Riccia fluitans TaxID=41844 RepID=A0ABD1YBQ7_9MARC
MEFTAVKEHQDIESSLSLKTHAAIRAGHCQIGQPQEVKQDTRTLPWFLLLLCFQSGRLEKALDDPLVFSVASCVDFDNSHMPNVRSCGNADMGRAASADCRGLMLWLVAFHCGGVDVCGPHTTM